MLLSTHPSCLSSKFRCLITITVLARAPSWQVEAMQQPPHLRDGHSRHRPMPEAGLVCSGTHTLIKEYVMCVSNNELWSMRDHHCVHRNPALTGSDAESVGLWGIHSPKITEFYSWPRPQSLRENELVPSKSKKPILFPTDLWKAKQVEVYHHLFSLGSSANHLTTLYPSFVLTGVQNGNALW